MRVSQALFSWGGWVLAIYLLVVVRIREFFEASRSHRNVAEVHGMVTEDLHVGRDPLPLTPKHQPELTQRREKPPQCKFPDLENLKKAAGPHPIKSEYLVTPYYRFNLEYVDMLAGGLKRHPRDKIKERPDRMRDIQAAVEKGAEMLSVELSTFAEGYARQKDDLGTEFQLFFRNGKRVNIFKPFSEYIALSSGEEESTFDENGIVHFIVPFTADSDSSTNSTNDHSHIRKLKDFLNNFKLAAQADSNLFLTLVWFTTDTTPSTTIKSAIDTAISTLKQVHLAELLISSDTTFTRGKALDYGVRYGTNKNANENQKNQRDKVTTPTSRLLFFCDIDVYFNPHTFPNTCRRSTRENESVFYPVVFSLYNPALVYESQGKIFNKKLVDLAGLRKINRKFGFWRDFGFGMTCQYQIDYENIGGFDLNLKGWGMEDVLLYRAYAKSSRIKVNRAPAPSLFHDWHEKKCSHDLSPVQLSSCLKSKAINEGSQVQLGISLFKNEYDRQRTGWHA